MSMKKIESVRTKRRKIRNEINLIEEMIKISNSTDYVAPEIVLETNHSSCIPSTLIHNDSINNNQYDIVSNEFISNISNNLSPSVKEAESSETFHTKKSIPDKTSTFSIREFIASWAVDFKVPQNAVNGLLKGLKMHHCFDNLPIDCRTILATPISNSKEIRNVNPGIYHHFGLAKGIQLHAPPNIKNIQIAIGIDGLPISKSSTSQFWPILASILVEPPLKIKVFLVGLYCGNEKPKDSNEYLSDFVMEAKHLETNGIIINKIKVSVIIKIISCDAPAKSFVLKTKGHSGFSSCTRCTIEGEYLCNRVCFPYSKIKSSERSHFAYINTVDEEYHLSDEISILTELQSFNAVSSFSLDYMHLVCLGVCKKLITLWTKGPLTVRLRFSKINELSSLLLASNSYITSDFTRKNRSIQDFCRWKATEFRLFLLYTGPVVLKTILPEEIYTNFKVLNIAMLILLSPDRKFLLQYARELLDFFVKNFQNIYGQHFVSHNVHALLHISDDYDLYGPLDNCSAFRFENFMKELKSNLRKHEKPLQQVINRHYEKYENYNTNADDKSLMDDQAKLKHTHDNGPLIENLTGPQYYTCIFKNITIKIKKESDSFILTKNKDVVKCLNFIEMDGESLFIGKKYKVLTPFYDNPINSTILDIFEIKELSDHLEYWKISYIKKKMMVLQHNGKNIAMPIIHTEV